MMKLDIKETLSAQTYAAYMIASSYFGSCICRNRQLERQTYMIYRTMGIEAQAKMENRIISLMEKRVLPMITREFLNSRVEVRFLPDRSGILITDGFEVLEIRQFTQRREYTDQITGIRKEEFRINIIVKVYSGEQAEGILRR